MDTSAMDSDGSDLSDDFVKVSKDCSKETPHADKKNQSSSAQFSSSSPTKPVFICQFCSAAFSVKSNCTRHEGLCDQNKSKGAAFTCTTCWSVFSRKDNLSAHQKKCSSSKPQCSERKNPCLFKDCGLKFYHKIALIDHIKSSHQHVTIKETVQKTFSTIQAFNVWKEKEEEDTFSYFTAKKGQKNSNAKHFYCQHDGSAKLHSSRKTSRCNNKGRIKVGHQCIAKIIARVKEGKVDVEYFPTHSHACKKEDMCHQPLPEAMSRFIDEKLAERIPPTVVYDLTKVRFLPKNSPNVQNIKANILTKKRILERGRRRRMARRLHKNDAKAVYLMATQLIETDDCVLLYKPYGHKVVHGPAEIDNLPDSKNLFMFAFQTERQRELMNRHCSKILIVDETHGTNQYKYNLLTAMVVDDNRRGWPIAHLITSKVKSDGDTLQFFFSCLKSRLDSDVRITCAITDDDPALINGIRAGISEDIIHLLCKWHVIKNLKDNLRRKSSSDLFDTILSEIKVLMNTENTNEFETLKTAFKKKYENNKPAKPFLDYLEKYYFKRCEKWAMCYRNFPHAEVNTTGHIESFHSRLKKTYLKRKVNKRLDDLIHILFDVEWEDHCTRTREANTGFSSRPQDIMERHQRGLSMEDDVIIEQVLNRVWEVKSASNSSQIYIVERHKESCSSDFCFCKCTRPECHGLCSHLFSCSCPDHHPLCKHIHKLQSFLTRGQPLSCVDKEEFYIFQDVSDNSFNNPNLEDNCRTEPSSSETQWQMKVDRLQSNIAALQQFLIDVQEKSVHEYSLTHADAILADLLKTLNLDNNKKELESIPAMDPAVSFAPNEKLKTQVSQIPSFKRPLSKRKREEDPSVLRQKKKAAIEGLLSYASFSPDNDSNVDDPDDDLVNNEGDENDNYKNFTVSSSYVSDPFDIVLQCGDEKISLIHLKSLELYLPPEEEEVYKKRDSIFHLGWLYSSIIDAFIYKLCLKFPAAFPIGSDLASRALKTSNANYFKRRLDELQSKSILFLPANLSGNHWIILVIFIKDEEIRFYDPMQGPLSAKCITLLTQTVSDMKVGFPSSSDWKIKVIRRPKQEDSHSCGPYICQFAAELVDPCFDASNAYEVRKYIYHVIVGNCLSRSDYFKEECGSCHVSYNNHNDKNKDVWLACSSCNQWFHLSCVDIQKSFGTFICP